MDVLDIVTELLARFGSATAALQPTICTTLTPYLNHARPTIRKRAASALANISPFLSDQLFDQLLQTIVAVISPSSKSNLETLKTYLGATMQIIRSSISRSSKYVANILPDLMDHIKNDDDEIKELCAQCLEILVVQYPTLLSPSIPAIINLCLTLVTYDPNYAFNDDDEMEEESEDEEMEEDYDE